MTSGENSGKTSGMTSGETNGETRNAAWIIARKELKLLFKSKRRVFLLSITPIMILLIGIVAAFAGSAVGEEVEPTQVWVVNDSPSNYTDTLLQYYTFVNDTEYIFPEGDIATLQASNNFNVLVHIPQNFTNLVMTGGAATVEIVYNANSSKNQEIAIVLAQITEIYEQQLLGEPQPDLLIPIIERYEEETDGISEELASNLFIIPVYIIFFVVIPPISLVMISVTIEREEKTLETLFLQPVTRRSIISGKILYGMGLILTVVVLDIIAAVIDIILIRIFVLDEVDGEFGELVDMVLDIFGIDLILYFLMVVILISVIIVGLAVLLSLIAKDEREANMISGVLPLAIFSIIFVVQIIEVSALTPVVQLLVTLIPVIGILLAFYISMVVGSLGLVALVSAGAQVLWIALIIIFTSRLSESESILELSLSRVGAEMLKLLRLKR